MLCTVLPLPLTFPGERERQHLLVRHGLRRYFMLTRRSGSDGCSASL
jgi:hypothetical protein